MSAPRLVVTEVTDRVFRARTGDLVSWYLVLDGSPVPVPTPGHSVGHTAFHLPGRGVVFTGDALVTGHPTSRRAGPQLLPGFFHHDRAGALASLAVLGSLAADVLLPGHGEPHRGDAAGAARAAAQARRR